MLDVKKTLAKLLNSQIKYKRVSTTVSATGGQRGSTTLFLGLPSGADVLSASIVQNPNANWVFGSISSLSNSSCSIGWWNSYSGTISGTWGIVVMYKLGGVAHRLLNLLTSKRRWAVC